MTVLPALERNRLIADKSGAMFGRNAHEIFPCAQLAHTDTDLIGVCLTSGYVLNNRREALDYDWAPRK